MRLVFTGFNGENRALHPLQLPAGIGRQSVNQRPGRGDLRPWSQPGGIGGAPSVATLPGAHQTIYRMGRDNNDPLNYWLSWSGDVDVVRSLIADDTTERIYWSGDGPPKWTDNTIGLTATPYPSFSRLLGVPAPVAAPTITIQTAGTGATDTRFYVWTWVTARGEESAPSPVSARVDERADAAFLVTFDDSIPQGRDITKKRLYRTVTGASGATDFYFLAEVAVGTITFVDHNTSPVEPLPSTTWSEPPSGLRGLKACWNGFVAGFVGKSLRFCEPYRPFAWPINYELVLDHTIVALAVFGQQLLALTTGRPYLITGTDPSSLTSMPLESQQACLSKRSVVEFDHGVAWACPDGLAYYGAGGYRLATAGVFLRPDWQALQPSSIVATAYEGAYLATFTAVNGQHAGFILDPLNAQSVYFTSASADGFFYDQIADALFLSSGGSVLKWDAGAAPMSARFVSRIEAGMEPRTFAWGCVIADAGSAPVLTITADGVVVVNAASVPVRQPFRLPAGFLASQWQVDISTTGAVQAVVLADSPHELEGSL